MLQRLPLRPTSTAVPPRFLGRVGPATFLISALFLLGCGDSEVVDPLPVPPPNWPMYGHDLLDTFTAHDSPVNAANVTSLALAWKFPVGDSISAVPSVVDGVVYVGAWDGFFYAVDALTGALRWKFQVDCQKPIVPIPPQCLAPGEMAPDRTDTVGGIITSTALVEDGRVYFAAGKTMYCLSAVDGSLIWKRVMCGKPEAPGCESDAGDPNQIFSSPKIFEGKIHIGTTVNGTDGYRGGLLALDAATGGTIWRFEVDPVLDASGNPVLGANGLPKTGQNRGCGNIWSSAAIDDAHRLVIYGTADCDYLATPPYHNAVLALDLDTGKVKWVYRPLAGDNTCDFDFGASANIMDLAGERYIGLGSKDGSYYVLKPVPKDAEGEVVWSTNVVFGGQAGGFIASSAFDGKRVYGGTALGDAIGPEAGAACDPTDPRDTSLQDPSFHAFDATTGAIAWQKDKNYTFAPTTVVNDVVFIGVGNALAPEVRAYDAATGAELTRLKSQGGVNSAVAAWGKFLYFGAGNSFDSTGSAIYAYALP